MPDGKQLLKEMGTDGKRYLRWHWQRATILFPFHGISGYMKTNHLPGRFMHHAQAEAAVYGDAGICRSFAENAH
jgi:hypothetical protein